MSDKTMCDGNNFEREIGRYIGETVTIFTTSGGDSGTGFTGVVLSVNRNYVRLITRIGTPPGWPLDHTCGDYDAYNERGVDSYRGFRAGSVTNIPIARIAAFVHNAV